MESTLARSGVGMQETAGAALKQRMAGVGRTLVVTAAVVAVSTMVFSLVMPALVPAFLIVPGLLLARRA